MDGERFDRLTRSFGRGLSRRRAIAAVAAAVGAIVAGRAPSARAITPPLIPCGGIGGWACPTGYVCVDAPDDSCDPAAGGADCGGYCVLETDYNPCAAILCLEGTTCCPNCGGICVPAGTPCSDDLCPGEPCGATYCAGGEYCCNPSCSICAPFGGGCTEQYCGGEPCGTTTCGADEYCCNSSCSVCARLGEGCTREYCGGGSIGEVCGDTVCPSGQVCCNSSCGICTPPGGACIMIACE